MSMLRLRSAEYPFNDARVAGQAARLLSLAESMGAWHPAGVVGALDMHLFQEALKSLAGAGVASSAALEAEGYAQKGSEDFAAWISRLRDAVASSPIPEVELPKLDELFSTDNLAQLLGVGTSTLRRYLAGERRVPDEIARRAHVVARIVGDLAGSYNELGIRQWFTRSRDQLAGRTPTEALREAWESEGSDANQVLSLADEFAG